MSRVARAVFPGVPYHICQRGNNKRIVFPSDEDRMFYLSSFKARSKKYKLKTLAYCLMNNHVHFIVIPTEKFSLSDTFREVNMIYVQYFNKKYKRVGHLWNGRYYSVMLDENHLAIGARYVERNPVRADLTSRPEEWEWSSAAKHISGKDCYLDLDDMFKYTSLKTNKWKDFVNQEERSSELCFARQGFK